MHSQAPPEMVAYEIKTRACFSDERENWPGVPALACLSERWDSPLWCILIYSFGKVVR
jgi:hypothetical protein